LDVQGFEEVPGQGVKGLVGSDSWVLGSAACLEAEGIAVTGQDRVVESVVLVGRFGI
jgi:cation transport ATPase